MPDELWNLEAEQITLGAMMLSKDASLQCTEILNPGDFYRATHNAIYDAIFSLRSHGAPADPVAVDEYLRANPEVGASPGAVYLLDLIHAVPTAANGPHYARIVADKALRRSLQEKLRSLHERAATPSQSPEDLLSAVESLSGVFASRLAEETGAVPIGEFVHLKMPHADPVIPGFLDQQERIIVVAPEGHGKSIAGIQAAVMTACGLHVWTADWIVPQRSLYADLENPPVVVQRRAQSLMREAERAATWDPGRCWIWSKPGGLDLRDARDQQLLMRVVAQSLPNLLVIGPAYKLIEDRGERGEQLYSTVTRFLDKIREKYGCAVWLEHHAPLAQGKHRDLRPIGSALWTRWPEYGMALRPDGQDLDVEKFRGSREERTWPVRLERSRPWPWRGIYLPGTFT